MPFTPSKTRPYCFLLTVATLRHIESGVVVLFFRVEFAATVVPFLLHMVALGPGSYLGSNLS